LHDVILPAAVAAAPLLALMGMACLFWYRGKERIHLAWTAAVFLGSGLLLALGEQFGRMVGLTLRNLPRGILLTAMLVSGVLGILFMMACLLPWELHDLAPVLRWMLKGTALIGSGLVLYCALTFGTLLLMFRFAGDEQVVHREGQTFVVVEEGFLDTVYDYYPYHSPLFRGRERVQRSYERPAITDE